MGQAANISDNRQFFRVKCDTPLCSQVTISKINDNYVNTGINHVCVENISSGGLKFLSNLNFPVNPHMVMKFSTVILKNKISFEGLIIRKTELEKGIFEYGVEFIIKEHERGIFVKLLNTLNYKLRRQSDRSDSSFCTKNKMECLRITSTSREKRAYFRFRCPSPLCAKMIVLKINNKALRSDSDNICIKDLGAGGLKFMSYLDLPLIKDILYDFQVDILNKKLFLPGCIVRKRVVKNGIFEYGVKFEILDSERKDLVNTIEEIKVNTIEKLNFVKNTFCSKNELYCLKAQNS